VGSSFANIHVRVGGADPETALDTVSAAVADWLIERGFALIDDQSGADRTVKLLIDPGGAWINVYDETMDIHEDHESFGSLAAALATAAGSVAVSTSVFDSDLAWIGLFEPSGQVAELVHGAEMDGSGQFAASMSRDFDRWRPLLVGDSSPEELERIWTAFPDPSEEDPYVFVEERLADACGLFGLDRTRATVGYRYLGDLPGAADGLRTLAFAIVDEAKAAASIGMSLERPWPGLFVAGQESLDTAAGSPFEMMLQLANFGPEPINGVLLWVQGSALDQGLVRLDRARTVVLAARPGGFEDATALFQAPPSNGPGLGAELDLRIAGWPSLTTSGAAYLATFQAQVGMQIAGMALARGAGSLTFAAFPRVDIETGAGPEAQGFEVDVTVR
jgi:hypothetical protein